MDAKTCKGLDNFSILRVCQGYVMQGKNRYFRRSHPSEAKFRALIRYFAHDLRAWKIAELKSSMLFPDKRSFYTSRNVNSDFITERKISLIEYLLY